MKRFLSILLMLVMLITTAAPIFAAPTPEEAMENARIYAVGDSVSYLLYDGDPQSLTPAYYTGRLITGETFEFPAYCINPHKPGPGEAGPFNVDTKDFITNPRIWGVVSNGYPYKTIGELGVHTREQAFYATKMALWTYINGWDVSLWTAANGEQNDTLTALKKIYAAGMAVDSIKIPMFTITPEQPKAELDALDPSFASQTFAVSANVEIRSYEVFVKGTAPDGTKITDLNNNPKTMFSAGEKFKVLIPADRISNVAGSIVIGVTGQLRTNAVIYGMSHDTALQDFSVTRDPFSFEDATATVLYAPQNTFIEIVKLAAGSNSPLAGAVFKVTGPDGVVGTFTTDSSGKVTVPLTKAGTYQVEELTPPAGYVPGTDIHKDVTVLWEQKTTVTFTNDKKPGLSIQKVDADTGKGLAGAVIRIAYQGGMKLTDVRTDASGWAYLTDIVPGTYSVTEITAPDGYILNNTPQTVILEPGKTATVTVANSEKPGLVIRKLDEDTGLPLAGAEFSVAKKGGAIVREGVTDSSGVIRLENLSAGWYTVTELAAPHGYLKTWEAKDVYLEPGKVVEVKFDNRLRPALKLIKLDAQTKQPLSGAKFKVQKTEDATVSEYVTGADGTITIHDLDEAVYSVWEAAAPDGYLLDEQHKDISLEWGKVKELVFTDLIRPVLEIVKLDSISRRPLVGVKFRVTKTESNTTSEYITGQDGRISIQNLDAAIYTVEEISVPDSHILSPGKQTVELEGGKTKTLIYENDKKPRLTITKTDDVTKAPLQGAVFNITIKNGRNLGDFTTDSKGEIVFERLDPDLLVITEVKAPDGYRITGGPQDILLMPNGDHLAEFRDKALSPLYIQKTDAKTGLPLEGAKYRVVKMNGELVGEYTTDRYGFVSIPRLEPGWYTVYEIYAPTGYTIDVTPKSVEVRPGEPAIVEFTDKPFGGLLIKKVDDKTGAAIPGVDFNVTKVDGSHVGDYTTDERGAILLSPLEPGTYVVRETRAAAGYILDSTPKTLEVKWGETAETTFRNKAMSGLQIIKLDADTKQPLKDAKFTVYRMDGGVIGTYETNGDGVIIIDALEPGWYKVTESKAPEGYLIDDTPRDVEITSDQFIKLVFEDRRIGSLQIKKVDEFSGAPLAGAKFTVHHQGGELLGDDFTTGADGAISIPAAEPDWYVIRETKAPLGYALDNTAKTIEVKAAVPTVVTFTNRPLSGIEILKTDATSHAPLSGATFTVERVSGERVGSYKTDAAGKIIVSGLTEGTYIVSETIAPEGYILDAEPQTVMVKSGRLTTAEFANKPLAGLKIIKLDSATRQPIAGVEFMVSKLSGEGVENEFRGTTFKTDKAGMIYIPGLENGYYTVTEIKAAEGYILDAEPKTVPVQSGKPTVLEVLNAPQSGLLIVKTDANTGKPLAGVVFDVMRADGQRVSGSLIDGNQPDTEANSPNRTTSHNGDISGSYTTDALGRILIYALPAGEYHVTEREALPGYELDTDVRAVTVTPGKLATLRLTNKPKAGIRILKIDSVTKAPIYGTEFMVFDANNAVVGRYITDNNGVIDFTGILSEGCYTVRESKAAPGYYLDEIPKTIELVSGKVTEIVWTNVPQMGQIQITKRSGDDSEVTGLPKGSALTGAVFEVYQYMTGNLVDRFISGSDGRAVSKPLPLGRYVVKEVEAPQWYKLSDQTLDIEVEFPTQILRYEFLNYSANTGVHIRKTGGYECMPGDTIFFTVKELRNDSTVPLTDFFWRDILPTDAVRLTKIVTGSYNQSLRYKVMVTTNKGDQRIIADNLSTTRNNVIDCSNASLGLGSDEYVTSFTLIFGAVKSGFTIVEQPRIYTKVLPNLANGYQFANKCDTGGKYGREWVVGASSWLVTTYAKPEKLPRTGY